MAAAEIHENEVALNNGGRLGHLTLDHPAALNATSLDMIEALRDALTRWERDPDVQAVLIDAVGDKAFCAGGDIVNLHRAITGEIAADYPARFFTEEYRLCHDLHRMRTPCIAWGHGIVMGGGCGLFSGASHRVVTETTRLAMPEIKIGLFPDCAATWFFNRLPSYLGYFVALTGASLNAADCLFAGLAEHAIAHAEKAAVLEALVTADWQGEAHATVTEALVAADKRAPGAVLGDSRLLQHAAVIRAATAGGDIAAIVERLTALAGVDDAWLAECGNNLVQGCPVTAHLIDRQLRDGRYLSLREAVQRELAMALACCAHVDFPEGVRALLVDKDKTPQWRFPSVADVPAAYVDAHFQAAWTGAHPLANLADTPTVRPN
ncbi:enoyl-CoA hydratase/isomerase family protein [Salinisphaera sp. Q1T1-3]|uniref:enoyl-CoA hydratase/isomerase family protein n=1 Tax=Salinisphaera sp. Q1T1-3 TaxID=2321229 RepID=UPI000E732F9C|nr:enoyl-CoA hydratase/isomerase family protein [Salinisphaera sp. Q1T1-3]RJS93314.1 enoyl-CoA hydratase/isomerase family protein [Salinisphaera sp. Q1T1-3]